MILITVNNSRLTTSIVDTLALNTYILDKMKLILDSPAVISNTFKTELYEVILKSYILTKVSELKLTVNTAYTLALKIDETKYVYTVVNYDIKDMVNGLDINQTLLT